MPENSTFNMSPYGEAYAMTSKGIRKRLRFLLPLLRQRSACRRLVMVIIARGLYFALLTQSYSLVFATDDAAQWSNSSRSFYVQADAAASSTRSPQPVVTHRPIRAKFGRESGSQDARDMAAWIVDSGDNRNMPFVIVDKKDAKVFVFYADGRLRGAAPALLGLALGDDAVPGIGNRKLSNIRPEERTTPAGRFEAALGRNLRGEEILWVDYDRAVSLHPVITNKPEERRAQRLATPTPFDNRISYGCINVPANFYNNVVRKAFTGTNGIVYVMPDTKSVREVFASYYDVK